MRIRVRGIDLEKLSLTGRDRTTSTWSFELRRETTVKTSEPVEIQRNLASFLANEDLAFPIAIGDWVTVAFKPNLIDPDRPIAVRLTEEN